MPESVKEMLIYLLNKIDSCDVNWDYDFECAISLIIKKLEE